MITIVEGWTVVDRWWEHVPIRTNYIEVLWDGRVIMFQRTRDDKVWRIVSATRTQATSTGGSYPAA